MVPLLKAKVNLKFSNFWICLQSATSLVGDQLPQAIIAVLFLKSARNQFSASSLSATLCFISLVSKLFFPGIYCGFYQKRLLSLKLT